MCLLAWMTYLPLHAQVSFGKAEKFNEGWLFSLSDDSLSQTNNFDDSKWRKLDLPHDWSIEGQLSPTWQVVPVICREVSVGIANISKSPMMPRAITSISKVPTTEAKFT